MIKVGQKAKDFKLPDQNGKIHKLSDYAGSWVLLYFYPKDDTPGCTKEACSIRDDFHNFKKLKLKVLGVSGDSVKSHKKFEEKYDLPFTILSDEKREVLAKYEALGEKSMYGKKYIGILRTSYLINPEGKIAKIYQKVNPEIHAEEVLKDLKSLKTNGKSK
jgi:peroxiredoxin Q/BCP